MTHTQPSNAFMALCAGDGKNGVCRGCSHTWIAYERCGSAVGLALADAERVDLAVPVHEVPGGVLVSQDVVLDEHPDGLAHVRGLERDEGEEHGRCEHDPSERGPGVGSHEHVLNRSDDHEQPQSHQCGEHDVGRGVVNQSCDGLLHDLSLLLDLFWVGSVTTNITRTIAARLMSAKGCPIRKRTSQYSHATARVNTTYTASAGPEKKFMGYLSRSWGLLWDVALKCYLVVHPTLHVARVPKVGHLEVNRLEQQTKLQGPNVSNQQYEYKESAQLWWYAKHLAHGKNRRTDECERRGVEHEEENSLRHKSDHRVHLSPLSFSVSELVSRGRAPGVTRYMPR